MAATNEPQYGTDSDYETDDLPKARMARAIAGLVNLGSKEQYYEIQTHRWQIVAYRLDSSDRGPEIGVDANIYESFDETTTVEQIRVSELTAEAIAAAMD